MPMRNELGAELSSAVCRVNKTHIDWLLGLGVAKTAIARIGAVQPPFGIAQVEFLKGSFWQPCDGGGGVGAMIQPVYEGGSLVDLIAWRSLKPSDWHWRLGEAWALGADAADGTPWHGFASLVVHATPLAWLASGGDGLVILNWSSPEVRRLNLFDELVCSDNLVADRLERLLSRPARVPRVKRGRSYVAA